MRDNFLYMNIYDDLKSKIDQGIYAEGSKIASDEELMNKFSVSMITVKKALSMLKDEGLIQRIPGVGTFVKDRNLSAGVLQMKENTGSDVKKIGLVMEHVSSSFGLDLFYKIDRIAEENGYKAITRFSYYSREKETEEINFLVDSQIAGLIIMPCHGVYYNPKILKLILEGFPVVVIDKKLEGISVPSVRTDNKQAIKTLVKHLYEQGCRKLGFISSEIVGTSSLLERKSGFYEAAGEYSVETLPECTLTLDLNIYEHIASDENIDKAAKYLEDNRGKIDGIICAEYSLVPAIMEASKRTNSNVGEDIRICCVDGPEGLAITHMKQNEIEMADKIVTLLLSQINGTSTETDIMVPAILMNQQI
jgi:DNA-binding LacI/PurR family transcriptional regulator